MWYNNGWVQLVLVVVFVGGTWVLCDLSYWLRKLQ